MINLTNAAQLTDRATTAQMLRTIDSAYSTLHQSLSKKPLTRDRRRLLSMAEAVASSVSKEADSQQIAQSLCMIANGEAAVDDEIALGCRYFEFATKSTSQFHIRKFCRLALYKAWCAGAVLLPVNFKMTQSVSDKMRRQSPSSVLQQLANYEPSKVETQRFGSHIQQWITQYSLSWIYCTNWISFSNIDVREAAQLHVFMSDYNTNKNGNPSSVEKAIRIFEGRGHIRLNEREYSSAKKETYYTLGREEIGASEMNAFIAPKKRSAHSFFYILPQLEVDGHAPPKKMIKLWDKLFNDYIMHREQTGRSASEKRKIVLHVLADYIAIMLPIFSTHSSEPIDMPVSPKKFTRYPFIDQTYRKKSFPTYLEYLKRRGLAKSSIKSNLYGIKDFFQWIELNLRSEDFIDIAGPNFRCPIHQKDFPFVPRPNSTTKIPFTEDVYPLLLLYVHEVERIGMHLEGRPEVALELCNLTQQAGNHIIDLQSLDVDFNITYQDQVFRITQIPQRLIFGAKKASQGINLSTLRLLIFLIETGQRGQNSQWLDNTTWAKHLDNYKDEDPIKLIHVNTDKTGTPKDIRVLSRVVNMLKRQQDHRRAKGIPQILTDYEGRTSSPFEPIVPLFASGDGSPISDRGYAEVWADLLLALQGCLHENGVEFKTLIKVKPPEDIDNGQSGLNGFSVCELNWSPVHTVHAARASFVTRRAGSTEYVILAELVGHNDPVTTAYYDATEYEEIVDILKHQRRPALDASSPVSELRSQLSSPDRSKEEVIHRFGISSLRDVHQSETSSDDPKGIELLKSSQSSELAFRDTHICVVGEMCPDDVILAAGGPMLCGTCKLACKSVDHLPAIEAKCRSLIARIQATSAALMREKAGKRDRSRLRRLHSDLSVDSYQLVGWQDASVTLGRLLKEKKRDGILAGSPDIIKLHLTRVVRQVRPAQFLVDRIVDAKLYPSLSDEVLRRQASRLARKLAMKETELLADENEEVMAMYSYIVTRLKALDMDWDDAGKIIEKELGDFLADTNSEVRLLNAGT